MNISIIGCGEVGIIYANAFVTAGCSLQLNAPRPQDSVLKFSSKHKIPLHTKIDSWLTNSDVVLSCVPSHAASLVVKEAIAFLKPGAIFADFSSSASEDKRNNSKLAALKKILFIDVAIMGSVELQGAKTPLVCAGEGCEKLVPLMQKIGAHTRFLSKAQAGDAIHLKLLRSLITKGISALAVEFVTAAEVNGVKHHLYELLSDIDQQPFTEFLDMLLRNHVMHSCRQRDEIAAATKELQAMNYYSILSPAIEKVFATTCEKSHNHPVKTNNLSTLEALQWLSKTRYNNQK